MLERERRAAIDAVIEASRVCRNIQSEIVSEETMAKKDRSPVTIADFASQTLIINRLQAEFPGNPIVAEEDARALRDEENRDLRDKVVAQVQKIAPSLSLESVLDLLDSGGYAGGRSGRFWTLDPIDGTKGFLRKDQYAVALALIENSEVVLGVLGCPNLPDARGNRGTLFVAVKGEGCFALPLEGGDEGPVHVDSISEPRLARFCESFESAHSSHSESARIAARLGVTAEPYRIDSQCKYAIVARGDASIYLRLPTSDDYREKIWDHAAGCIVIREAGGKVTDRDGNPLDFGLGRLLQSNRGVIVTNGRIHDAVIEAVRG